ncbi:hypothetical protein PVAP13_1NG301238 [Panicum virgatum]|uniref:ABC transmembrane type-1 domain-containing protein n=1 Tax=Panicum virgatum TaxID=38727 RepID=A0A8T0WPW9_PANVG|nr:hypothetical protein PVAP13_1NG301238 [Panicum virgatum]
MPVFFLLFGELVNGFGKNQHNLRRMTDEASKYSLYFVYLGLVVCASSYLEIACWMYTGERQVSALRRRYLEAVLRQDVGFFDTDALKADVCKRGGGGGGGAAAGAPAGRRVGGGPAGGVVARRVLI